jgi:leucyl aminopeptidase (aminopeptidase T)
VNWYTMIASGFTGRASVAVTAFLLATSPPCSQEHGPVSTAQEGLPQRTTHESRVADQVVQGLFQVAPGEQVVLRGGPRYLPMLEAIAIAVLGAGGKAHILITTDGERHYRAERLPLQYLGPPPSSIDSALILQSDLEINLPYDSDFRSVWPDLESERFRRHQRSNPILSQLNDQSTRRYLYLAMPSQAEVVTAIKAVGLDSATYTELWWRAASASIDSMAEQGAALRRQLQRARKVRVTTPDGTDFTFMPSDQPAHLDVAAMSRVASRGLPWTRRQASFPAGVLTVLPVEQTVNGQVRAAADQCDRPVSREAFELRRGRPQAIRAATDEACVQGGLGKAGAMGFLSIGLNPAMKPVLGAGGNFLPEQALGLISLGFGDNVRFGGTNTAPRWVVPLTHATLLADGVAVLRDGRLVASDRGS